jgi:DnaJ homolog subfamily C member 9
MSRNGQTVRPYRRNFETENPSHRSRTLVHSFATSRKIDNLIVSSLRPLYHNVKICRIFCMILKCNRARYPVTTLQIWREGYQNIAFVELMTRSRSTLESLAHSIAQHQTSLHWQTLSRCLPRSLSGFFSESPRVMACDGEYYKLLGLPPTATVAEIKRAFRRVALSVHPDRNPAADAHAAFQQLRRVHDVLTDDVARARYDSVGETEGNDDDDAGVTSAFWANAAAKVSKEDIAKYEKEYPRSKEEEEDLMEHYQRFDGKVGRVVDYIPFSGHFDLLRFLAVWDAMIEDGRLGKTLDYVAARRTLETLGKAVEKKRTRVDASTSKKSATDETSAAKPRGDDALAALIRGRASAREKDFDAWADSLAEKYPAERKNKARAKGNGKGNGKGKKSAASVAASAAAAPAPSIAKGKRRR